MQNDSTGTLLFVCTQHILIDYSMLLKSVHLTCTKFLDLFPCYLCDTPLDYMHPNFSFRGQLEYVHLTCTILVINNNLGTPHYIWSEKQKYSSCIICREIFKMMYHLDVSFLKSIKFPYSKKYVDNIAVRLVYTNFKILASGGQTILYIAD